MAPHATRGGTRSPLRAGTILAVLALAPAADLAGAQDRDPQDEALELINAGNHLRALEVLDGGKAAAPPKSLSNWWQLRAGALLGLGRDAEALESAGQSVALDPQGLGRLRRAALELRRGRCEETLAELASFAGTDPAAALEVNLLRFGACGPFQERWPRASRRLQARSAEGHFDVVALAGTNAAEMDQIEKAAATLDPGKPGDKRRLDALLAPTGSLRDLGTLLEAVRRETLAALGLSEKDWPAGRVLRLLVCDPAVDWGPWRARLGPDYVPPWVDRDTHFAVMSDLPGPRAELGLEREATREVFSSGCRQLLEAHRLRVPRWLRAGLSEYLEARRVTTKGGRFSVELGVLERGSVRSVETWHHVMQSAIGAKSAIPWRQWFRMTDENWRADSGPARCAQAWAVVYYLAKGRNAELRQRFSALIADVRSGKEFSAAVLKHFPDDALDRLEAAWLEYLRKL